MARKTALQPAQSLSSGGSVLRARFPALIERAGSKVVFHSLEFFAARLPNDHRAAYTRAVSDFCRWAEGHGLELGALSSPVRSISDALQEINSGKNHNHSRICSHRYRKS